MKEAGSWEEFLFLPDLDRIRAMFIWGGVVYGNYVQCTVHFRVVFFFFLSPQMLVGTDGDVIMLQLKGAHPNTH